MIAEIRKQYIESKNEAEGLRNEIDEKIDSKREKTRRLQNQIAKLHNKRFRIKSPSWLDSMVIPIAEELSKRLDLPYEIYGPFGLRCQTSIYFRQDMNKSITEQPVKHISIVPGNLSGGELLYETGRRCEGFDYPRNSIADLNGFGNETLPLPDDIEEVLKLIRESDSSIRLEVAN